jgi:transcription antitermination factor NusG
MKPELKVGDAVTIQKGLFAGQLGVIVAVLFGEQESALNVQLRSWAVWVGADNVQKV